MLTSELLFQNLTLKADFLNKFPIFQTNFILPYLQIKAVTVLKDRRKQLK